MYEILDHFLSGYSECGFRQYRGAAKNGGKIPAWNESDYDHRVSDWLDEVKQSGMCERHSYPQVSFLLNGNGQFYPQIKAIGDMKEMSTFLEQIAEFPYNHSIGTGRNATQNELKMKHFPSRKDLLSTETIQKICQFVALDYYFLDFEPPVACQGIITTAQPQPEGQLERLQQQQLHDQWQRHKKKKQNDKKERKHDKKNDGWV